MTSERIVAGPLDLTPDDVLTTTRTVRRRLDVSRSVSRDVVEECLRIALQAPSGENSQPWAWVLVDDPALRAAMADIYRDAFQDFVTEFRAAVAAGEQDPRARMGMPPPDENDPVTGRVLGSFMHLCKTMQDVPVLVVPLIRSRLEGMSLFESASLWGSVLPAAWSFMLALRTRGLGSAWTTAHLRREADMAQLLGIPMDTMTQVGLFPVAYTLGTDFRPAKRADLDSVASWNRWSPGERDPGGQET